MHPSSTPNQDGEHFCYPHPSASGKHWPAFCYNRLALPLLEFHINGLIRCLLFSVWLPLHGIMSLEQLQAAAAIHLILLYRWLVYHRKMSHSVLIHPLRLTWFSPQFMSICVSLCIHIFNFFFLGKHIGAKLPSHNIGFYLNSYESERFLIGSCFGHLVPSQWCYFERCWRLRKVGPS